MRYPMKEKKMQKQLHIREIYQAKYSNLVREQICRDLVMECIFCDYSFSELYRILREEEIYLSTDQKVHLGLSGMTKKLDFFPDEQDCVQECMSVMKKILGRQALYQSELYKLVNGKDAQKCYPNFMKLYQDMSDAKNSEFDIKFGKKLLSFLQRNRDKWYRICMQVGMILGVIILLDVLSGILFGNVFFYHFFVNTFEQIGTVSLGQ